MSRQNLVLFVIFAMLATMLTHLFLSMEKTEAAPITITTVSAVWRCYHGATLCDSASGTYTETDEPFWHWINIFVHPHSTAPATATDIRNVYVSRCSFCKRPKWAP